MNWQTLAQQVRAFGTDSKGAVIPEYLMLLVVVGMVLVVGLVHYGPVFVYNFERTRNAILIPAP